MTTRNIQHSNKLIKCVSPFKKIKCIYLFFHHAAGEVRYYRKTKESLIRENLLKSDGSWKDESYTDCGGCSSELESIPNARNEICSQEYNTNKGNSH